MSACPAGDGPHGSEFTCGCGVEAGAEDLSPGLTPRCKHCGKHLCAECYCRDDERSGVCKPCRPHKIVPHYHHPRGATLYAGDALAILRDFADASVDMICTDPPYSSGGAFRGDRMQDTTAKYVQTGTQLQRCDFSGDNRDQRAYLFWCALWLSECLRIAKPGSPICIFTDWRQLPTTIDALQCGGWIWRGIKPWNKGEGVRPVMGRFRSQCEYVVWGSAGPMPMRTDVGVLPGWFECPSTASEKYSIAGKPLDVLREIVRICPPGGIVLDPFAGGATALVAAVLEGRRGIGCEHAVDQLPVAIERIKADLAQGDLFQRSVP